MSRVSPLRLRTAAGIAVGTAAAVVGLGAGTASAEVSELPTPVLSPSTVTLGGDPTVLVSGSACSEAPGDEEAFVYAYIEFGPGLGEGNGMQAHDEGTWTFDLSIPDGVEPGVYPVQAVCDLYEYEVDYPLVHVTVVAPSTADPSPVSSAPTSSTATTSSTSTSSTSTTSSAPRSTAATGQIRGTSANTPGVASPDTGRATGDSTAPGRKVVKVLTGFRPGEVVTVTLHSTPRTMGTFTADANGTVTVEFTVPAGTPTGDHTLVYEGDMGTYFQEAFAVTAGAASPSLAYTGASVALPLGLGAGALALGGGLVVAARRRSSAAAEAVQA